MDNEWKRLNPGDIPSDLFIGDYEFIHIHEDGRIIPANTVKMHRILEASYHGGNYKYRVKARVEGARKMNNKCEWKDGGFIPCEASVRSNFGAEEPGIAWGEEPIIFCPFCGASLEKPVVIEVGMFGKFWDGKESRWGELKKIDNNLYVPERGIWYRNFTPGLPTGFNQDGTVKEIEA